MKRMLSFILVLAMAMTMCMSAFADNTTTIGGTVNNTEAYELVIPEGNMYLDLENTYNAQDIGELKVIRASEDKDNEVYFNTSKMVNVTVTSANSGNLKNTDTTITENNTLAYELGFGSTYVTDWTTAPVEDFYHDEIDNEYGIDLTAIVKGDATKVKNGTYQDVLTFTAKVQYVPVNASIYDVSIAVDKGTTWAQWAKSNPSFDSFEVSVDDGGYIAFYGSDGAEYHLFDYYYNHVVEGIDLIQDHYYQIRFVEE